MQSNARVGKVMGAGMNVAMSLVLAAVGLAAGSASAQNARLTPMGISMNPSGTMHVTPWGQAPEPLRGGPTDACTNVASHTDANFEGGQFVLQAGFAQGELLAATYTVPANQFPIKIDLCEVIFGSVATVQTTTKWSILIFDGEPNNGVLVDTFSSDGDLLPHIVIPQGGPGNPQGVNLQFSVDPGDPDQIIIDNVTGTGKFTIAWRIDQHNNQTGNPCLTAPSQNANAFPTTDVSGLSSPAGNWLFGLNCGPLGCPPNGGWVKFSQLNTLCKPSGDWVTRTTWTSVNCAPGVGACCKLDGTCDLLTATQCTTTGGLYQGDGTDCGSANCPLPTGACCFSNGNCLTLTAGNCSAASGTYLGNGSACAPNSKCPTGACCLATGLCIGGVTLNECQIQGGTFKGVGSLCSGVTCPQPSGACCLSNGNCLFLTQADCGLIPGTTWQGIGSDCADTNGNGLADDCEAPACYADCDMNGSLVIDDFICFQTNFAIGDPSADCDGNTVLAIDDFICYQTFFALGC
jgi:hypothetical protein